MNNHTHSEERAYLRGRLFEIVDAKTANAGKDFGTKDDEAPLNWTDLIKRIEDKQFVLDEKMVKRAENNNGYYGPFYGVKWRDPNMVEDHEGYDAWKVMMSAERDRVEDDIQIKEPKEALESLRAFELN